MTKNIPQEHFLKDYQSPQYEIKSVYLTFYLSPNKTQVINHMVVEAKGGKAPLLLDGDKSLTLVSIKENNQLLLKEDYELNSESLTLFPKSNQFELEIVTEVDPESNTYLEGLYRTNGNYCTQCEAEGFRRITYYMDRPDVLSSFTTKIVADKAESKVLLSNGNLIESGDLPNNQHYAVWEDPYKKPCYLFALVAGNLEVVEDTFVTQENREVALKIYVEARNLDKCEHAMQSLKKSMQWDEERFGLAYDLDVYMIVAVDDFNMGAMENKGLNVFNSKYVLAKPESATDHDFEGIESVIGHEYFHNWTGNRITCRDWFQLTLKEGLTVFRDQEFTADMLSPDVKRIEDVKRLRNNQFPEDAGPMAHPIQPQSYIEMNNFYTMTVYEKGAEVVRLYHTLLGEKGFQQGMKRYIECFDGQAVTIQDFRQAMAEANDVNLNQMHHWYIQPGTPHLKVTKTYNPITKCLALKFSQFLNGKQVHLPLLIPVLFGFMDEEGTALPIKPSISTKNKVTQTEKGMLLKVTQLNDTFEFMGLETEPYLSLLRHFSAPVSLDYKATEEELMVLASHDSDSFVRWESIQKLAMLNLKENVIRFENSEPFLILDSYLNAFKAVLEDNEIDLALKSLAMALPDVIYFSEQYEEVNMDAILASHNFLKKAIAEFFEESLLETYQALEASEKPKYRYHKEDIANRMLKNRCLNYLLQLPKHFDIGVAQYQNHHNMTDVLAALEAMNHLARVERAQCLEDFYQRWQSDNLVIDKWFALQASAQSDQALEDVKKLTKHPDFTYHTPNRLRSLLGVFGRLNFAGFHDKTGEGYQFLAEEVLKVDKLNPQVAARLASLFSQWQRLAEPRKTLMYKAIEHIASAEDLSKDVFEIVSKTLKSHDSFE
ncbi:Aminopeptidase N [Hydrogenovibrio crunogenus]|uniref:Aminopeptidase N n=1 Tax=Hydrogenovibrio crunogenus TaxID=39765 RepID=A0A4P7P117_9GAMM|nr:aminopeptidase N [Hydrogenovibrio crunogenus]QBZ83515.1 Aminopeptidase N [Hydrogenovibrio crunogenus]